MKLDVQVPWASLSLLAVGKVFRRPEPRQVLSWGASGPQLPDFLTANWPPNRLFQPQIPVGNRPFPVMNPCKPCCWVFLGTSLGGKH